MPYLRRRRRGDYLLSLIVFILAVTGLILISSASVVISFESYGTNYHYLNRQAISFVIGILAWAVTSSIDYRIYKKYAVFLLFLTFFLLILVFIPGIGKELGGAHRWLSLGPIFFQPSEVIKLTFILYLAALLDKSLQEVSSFLKGLLPFAALIGVIIFLIIRQPDMGTTVIIVAASAVMFFVAGASVLHLGAGLGFLGFLFWFLIKSSPYRFQRFLTFLQPSPSSLESSYHINQALLAIGSGGLLGRGFGQSIQKYLYLPQAHTDSIFAIAAEELGFLRVSLILLLYVFLIFRGYAISRAAPDKYSRLVSIGITSWFGIQTFVNLGAMTGLLPLTGVPLPFISFGGSSLVVSLAAVGILMNISKQIKSS